MSENPLQALCHNMGKLSSCIQTHLSNLIGHTHNGNSSPYIHDKKPLFSISPSSKTTSLPSADSPVTQHIDVLSKGHSTAPVTKEELGRATWTFLHTLAAQVFTLHQASLSNMLGLLPVKYPDYPTRQQKKDVKELMMILSRMYPCQECADHFKEVLRANPVQVGSHAEFSQWLCHIHNVVNRSLGKKVFPCARVDARWGKLECEKRACDVQGTLTKL